MSRVEHIIKAVLLALASLSLLAVVVAWILKLYTDTLPHVASLRNAVLFVTVLCFGVAVAGLDGENIRTVGIALVESLNRRLSVSVSSQKGAK